MNETRSLILHFKFYSAEEDAGFVDAEAAEEVPQVPLTESETLRREEAAALEEQKELQRQKKWKPYLFYFDDLVSKVLVQATSTRFKITTYYFSCFIVCDIN